MRSFLAAAAGSDARDALAALTATIAEARSAPPPAWLGTSDPLDLDIGDCGPELLISCFEATIEAPKRRRTGSHFTPDRTAAGLVRALDDVAPTAEADSICDPTVGGGTFLLAALRNAVDAGSDVVVAATRLWGADIDPLAVDVARTVIELEAGAPVPGIDERLVVGDSLFDLPWASAPAFGLVIGNPPFLSQLRGAGVRSAEQNEALARLLDAPMPAYAETALVFVLRSLELAADGATVAMIQPQSVLTARDNRALRLAAERVAALRGLWFSAEPVFDAGVRVCAPVFVVGAEPAPLQRWVSPEITPAAPIDATAPGEWAEAVVDLLGIPTVDLGGARLLGEIADSTAGFRDEFYAICEVVDEGDAATANPVITSGLIDPLRNLWGARSAKLGGIRYDRPVLRSDALDGLEPRIRRWVDARLVPKVLVATQTKVIEAVADPDGTLVPITPVISVQPAPDDVWMVAAVLSSPPVSAWAARRTIGSALSVDAVKLSAAQLRALPLPPPGRELDEAVELARGLSGGSDRRAWEDFGNRMCAVYSVPADDVVPWWLNRMRWNDEEGDR